MTTELATIDPTHVPVSSANKGAARIREAAEVMVLCKQIADAVCNTNMMPKHLRGKPEETAAVMLYGATLDLDPMQSVRSIYEVHGQPGLYGKAMVGLLLGRGHEVWTEETSDGSVTVAGRRRGAKNVERSTWTIERATKAGYVPTIDPDTGNYRLNKWGKLDGNEKYLTDPQAMLYAKAASEVCRKVAPDVLAGVYAVEDLESENWAPEPTRTTVEQVAPAADRMRSLLGTQTSDSEGGREPDSQDADGPQVRPSGSEPDPGEEMTARTRGRMFALFTEQGISDRAEQIRGIVHIIGRSVESRSEITDDEGRAVIAQLEKRPMREGSQA